MVMISIGKRSTKTPEYALIRVPINDVQNLKGIESPIQEQINYIKSEVNHVIEMLYLKDIKAPIQEQIDETNEEIEIIKDMIMQINLKIIDMANRNAFNLDLMQISYDRYAQINENKFVVDIVKWNKDSTVCIPDKHILIKISDKKCSIGMKYDYKKFFKNNLWNKFLNLFRKKI